jgi:acetyl-CoA carboxylase biotin carboxyl carrier protein
MSTYSDPPLTAEDIAEIVDILDSSPYDSLELSTSRYKLRITREGDAWTQEAETLAEPHVAEQAGSTRAGGEEGATASVSEPSRDGLVDVPAPMMGTFYRAPKPGADPFVEVGSRVEEQTVIAIIEVMKLMNSIRAGVEGEVAEICIENGQAVEQNQTLIRVKPD